MNVFFIDFMNSSLQSGYQLKSVSQIPIIIFSISLLYAIDDAIDRKRRFLPEQMNLVNFHLRDDFYLNPLRINKS